MPTDLGSLGAENGENGLVHWFTTGLFAVQFFQQFFGRDAVYYAINALLIITSFACTWSMFRSAVFSYTVALCMGFGTHFLWARVCSSVQGLYLYSMYVEVNLLCLYWVLRGDSRR